MTEIETESGAEPNKAVLPGGGGGELVKYDAMCRAIAEAHSIDEVKDIRDKAIALEAYARQIGNTEAEDQCYQIRMRAQRKAGELTKQIEKAAKGSAVPGADGYTPSPHRAETAPKKAILEAAGISTQCASEWERLSEVPEEQFEAALAANKRATIREIINPEPAVCPVSDDALLFVAALQDIERLESRFHDHFHLCELLRAVRGEFRRIQIQMTATPLNATE